ncbi:hypothetical protein F2Q69_00023249 [Brassica cretica]|uniref:Uncharacterized protein n=1 Tax=Brassica cretica TaxID=69181 RepID=A0A8S9QJ07_BRACR|nr:hypothetical protein F2Q69_00023249 [Brassica cretica]
MLSNRRSLVVHQYIDILANIGDCETGRKTEQDDLITKQVKVSPWVKRMVGAMMSKMASRVVKEEAWGVSKSEMVIYFT